MTNSKDITNIVLEKVHVQVGAALLLNNVSFHSSKNELIAIVGPNGAGKTSLLRTIAGLTPPTGGSITLNDRTIQQMPPLERAKLIAYLPQIRPLAWPMRVRDVVALGRFAFGAAPGKLTGEDERAVSAALDSCELVPFAKRSVNTLSGGELARVHVARVLVAETPILLADEPITALDPRLQLKTLSLIKAYVKQGATAIIVVHDIGLASRFADRIIWMRNGKLIADGPPGKSVTKERIYETFGVDAAVVNWSNTSSSAARPPIACLMRARICFFE